MLLTTKDKTYGFNFIVWTYSQINCAQS